MKYLFFLLIILSVIKVSAQNGGGLGSYLSRTTSMAVRAETLKEESDNPEVVDWQEGLLISIENDSLYGYIRYDGLKSPEVIEFKNETESGQQTFDIRNVSSFSFLTNSKKYVRYFTIIHSGKKQHNVLEKVVAGKITYWKKAKVYHYGSRSSNTITVPKVEYDYFFSTSGQFQKVKNFKKQLEILAQPYDVSPETIAKSEGLKLSNSIQRAMLVYHVNQEISNQ